MRHQRSIDQVTSNCGGSGYHLVRHADYRTVYLNLCDNYDFQIHKRTSEGGILNMNRIITISREFGSGGRGLILKSDQKLYFSTTAKARILLAEQDFAVLIACLKLKFLV